ncbi:MAG: hypothetical protein J4F34_05695 [Gemmatimonadetes bacterium]|nr:hypothetical protein [Gemmatimonadota bacterium]
MRALVFLALAGLWMPALAGCSSDAPIGSTVGLQAGDTLPAVARPSGSGAAVVWALAVSQCLGCELDDLARVLRRLQRTLKDDLEVVVVAVGEGEEDGLERVETWLKAERIPARVVLRDRGWFQREFGVEPLPILYVVDRRSVVVGVVAAADAPDQWRSTPDRVDLDSFVARLAVDRK